MASLDSRALSAAIATAPNPPYGAFPFWVSKSFLYDHNSKCKEQPTETKYPLRITPLAAADLPKGALFTPPILH